MPIKSLTIFFALVLSVAAAWATDADAEALLEKARTQYREKDFYAAAKTSLDAEHMADSTELKAKAVKYAVMSYRQAGTYYKEFENIEKLLTLYPMQADYTALVHRQFQIGDTFFHGYRDPAYYSLRWVPWFKDESRAVEVYEKAIEHAPFAAEAAQAKLRTAIHIIEHGDGKGIVERSVPLLRRVVTDHPGTEEARMAQLRLGVVLAGLAQSGDGDGAYNRDALAALNDYKIKYPDSGEIEYIDKLILRTRDIQAKRLVETAEFYRDNNRPEAAERHLSEAIRLYPDTPYATKAEQLLTAMDLTYIPQPMQPAIEPRIQRYEASPLPTFRGRLLMAPQNSRNKHLLPIYDLGIDKLNNAPAKPQESLPEEIEDAI